ncbi:MAG: hypothetical protein IT269_07460 [Saprospiraceae bacterium]|nr:hypothetical protein [Saprospiraceae bacterium]
MPDLFEFFKENESKLQERPPEKLWQQLEQQLDRKRRPRRRGIRFLHLGQTALVLLILIFIAIMVWYFISKGLR